MSHSADGAASDPPESAPTQPAIPDPSRVRTAGARATEHVQAALVLGHSRDPASLGALLVAADLARRLGAHLHVVHGLGLGDYPIDPDAADWEEQASLALAEQHEQVKSAMADVPTGWTYHAAHGDPVLLISAVAEENNALMIILGTRGEGFGHAMERLLGHSVSHGVIHHQHRPVLVVPAASEH